MADITMCSGLKCPRAMQCYRHTAKENPYRQSFFCTPPVDTQGHCPEFWDNGFTTDDDVVSIADYIERIRATDDLS